MIARLVAVLLSLCLAAPAGASGWVQRVVSAYHDPAPIRTDSSLTMATAARVQQQVVAGLRPTLGGVFGYKAGLTSPAARRQFNVDAPILGTLLDGMILEDGARVSAASGVRLLIEADLLVRIGDRRINEAETRAQAMAALDRVAPFLEVPDVIIEPGQPVDGPILTAVNSGARWGVTGRPIPIDELEDGALAGFAVRLERDGETVAQGDGRALMGHPLEVVLWMVREARQRGIGLAPGQWLSLGSLTPPAPVAAGQSYRAIYQNLGGEPVAVGVRFVP